MEFKPIKQDFQVSYSYGLYFTEDVFSSENTTLRDIVGNSSTMLPAKVLFFVDQGVLHCHPNLKKSLQSYSEAHKDQIEITQVMSLPGGESVKNDLSNVDKVLEAVEEYKICRHSFVVVIGGGAVIDLVGYAAAIAHRGVRLIRIPTTVLSQNDAAVGVKNGVNILGKKNFIGTFEPPYAVINDHRFLSTLEDRDWIAGIAEAVKVALIKDKDFYHYIADNAEKLKRRDSNVMQYVIYRCAELHMQHIAEGGDPFERGSSRPLDFGHWSAHKLENMMNYQIRHGEAVAKGIALDLTYAYAKGFISESLADEILQVFKEIGFDLQIPLDSEGEIDELLKGIEEFREHLGGQLTITLIEGIGKKKDVHEIDLERMKEAISHLNVKAKLNLA